ncbi:MAG: hypothetical protein ACPGZT_07950, partial [Luminiphilus sp.]
MAATAAIIGRQQSDKLPQYSAAPRFTGARKQFAGLAEGVSIAGIVAEKFGDNHDNQRIFLGADCAGRAG